MSRLICELYLWCQILAKFDVNQLGFLSIYQSPTTHAVIGKFVNTSIDWLIDFSMCIYMYIDRLICLIYRLSGQYILIDWLIYRYMYWFVNVLIDWSVNILIGWLINILIDWLFNRCIDPLVKLPQSRIKNVKHYICEQIVFYKILEGWCGSN